MKPVVLCILDGWGIDQTSQWDATREAVFFKDLCHKYPSTTLHASESYVGLPAGQMGNSEVGHTTIGLGRVVLQDLERINQNLNDDMPQLENLLKTQGTIHLMGLLSKGGVHSHMNHFQKAINILHKHQKKCILHIFLDGRDTPPKQALEDLKNLDSKGYAFGTMMGRFYAMDRDQRFGRTKQAYDAMMFQKADYYFNSPEKAIEFFYAQDITDEFIPPCVFLPSHIKNGDSLWMINFRSDRVRQLLNTLLNKKFNEFHTAHIQFDHAIAMTSYSHDLDQLMTVLFKKEHHHGGLGEIVSQKNIPQLRIAETEKYAHVTFFFNGGQEDPFPLEDRILIPSPKVKTYDLEPNMSAVAITDILIDKIKEKKYGFIVVNYANADMVGHSGRYEETKRAILCLDECVKRLSDCCLKEDVSLIVTSDHGNAECMRDAITNGPHTAHTLNPVPLVIVDSNADSSWLPKFGGLKNVQDIVLKAMFHVKQ